MIDDDERREIAARMTDTYRFGDWVAYDPGEGVCALLSLFAEGGRVVFHVLPSDFCAGGAERGNNGA